MTLEIPWRTLLKVILAVALVWLFLELYQIVLLIVVAALLAVTLNPVVEWLERHRWPRWLAAFSVSIALLAVAVAFVWMTWSSLSAQAALATSRFSEVERVTVSKLPGWMRASITPPQKGDVTSYLAPYALRFASSAMTAAAYGLLGFILMIYLLIEAEPTRQWIVAFASEERRPKVEHTLRECERVVVAYALGNVVTSLFAFGVTLAVLLLLHVPAALLLAVVAGLADFVPVIGFIASAVPAIVLALTVSGTAALAVAVAYAAYHGVENYFVGPWIYGSQLKLSNVAIVLAFAVGAEVLGVIGALIALPAAAIYPTIERIWLREQLGETTLREHRKISRRVG